MKHKWTCSSAAAVLAAVILTMPAGATVRIWDDGDPGNSYWHDPENWDPDGYSLSDDLIVTSGGPTAVADVTTDNGGSITLHGPASVPDFGSRDVTVANTGEAMMEILNAADLSNEYGYVGFASGSEGHVTVSGAGSTWASGSLYIGQEGTGTLTINHGGAVSDQRGNIGVLSGSQGDVTVSGAGSTWTNSSYLYVGYSGTGTLRISDGGTVSNNIGYLGWNSSGDGHVMVSGTGSTWTNGSVYLGEDGTGTLTISDGGAVNVGGPLRITRYSTSTGTVNLEGGSLTAESVSAGSGSAALNWTGGTLEITGAAGLTLSSGGLLGSVVGINHDKGLRVSAATTVNSGVKLAVTGGTFSTETLTVSGTAQLRGGTITIGDTFAVNSIGELEITGQDILLLSTPTLAGDLVLDQTTLSVPSMTVASGASLDLDSGRISASATFTNQNVVRMGNTGPATIRAGALSNTGALMGQGSIQAVVANTGNIALSGDSSFTEDVTNQSGGKIIVSGGSAVTFFDDVDNQSGAEIRVSKNCTTTYFGDLSGTGSFTGTGTSYIEGDMRPGSSPGVMAFEGDVVFGPAAALEVELEGTDHDQLESILDVYLDGTLEPVILDKLAAACEQQRTIITTDQGTIHDDFSDGPSPGDYLDYGVFYRGAEKTAHAYNLVVFQAVEGDTDGDADVDPTDLSTLVQNWAPAGTDKVWREGNFDDYQDGNVDPSDLSGLVQNWAPAGYCPEGVPPTGSAAAVPEPSALVMLAVLGAGLMAAAARHRRRHGATHQRRP